MTSNEKAYLFRLLNSIDESLKKLVDKRKVKGKAPKRNKHKPAGPSYMDK